MPSSDVLTPDLPRVTRSPGPVRARAPAAGVALAARAAAPRAAADWPRNWRRVSGVIGVPPERVWRPAGIVPRRGAGGYNPPMSKPFDATLKGIIERHP